MRLEPAQRSMAMRLALPIAPPLVLSVLIQEALRMSLDQTRRFAPLLVPALALSLGFANCGFGCSMPPDQQHDARSGLEREQVERCKLTASIQCPLECNQIDFDAFCDATLGAGCDNQCDTSATGTCLDHCRADCAVGCDANAATDCDVSCHSLCGDNCTKICVGAQFPTQCAMKCKGECRGLCGDKCKDEAASSCDGTCGASCNATCSVEAHVACQIRCSVDAWTTCKAQVQANCMADCSTDVMLTCGEPDPLGPEDPGIADKSADEPAPAGAPLPPDGGDGAEAAPPAPEEPPLSPAARSRAVADP